MYPKPLFPGSPFPLRLFPFAPGNAGAISKYAQILLSVQSTLQKSVNDFGIFPGRLFPLNPYPNPLYPKTNPQFGTSRVPIILHPQPYPISNGPIAFVMPGESHSIDSQVMGAGRYYAGFNSSFKIRVVDKILKDYTGTDTLALTQSAKGIMRSAHFIIDQLDIEFPLDNNGINLTEEPIVLSDYSYPQKYKGAEELYIIDLTYKFPYSHGIVNEDPQTPSLTGSLPLASNMADLLLSVQSAIISQGFLNVNQCPISLYEQPPPLVGGPFCLVRPGAFNSIDVDKYGAGRYYATMEGTFTVTPVVHNTLDITGYADNLLTTPDPSIALYSLAQYLTEQLELYFLIDPNGNFIAENPLCLQSIGLPRYYSGNSAYAAVDLTFRVRYQENLTLPDSPVWS